jgi:hypothetical protein
VANRLFLFTLVPFIQQFMQFDPIQQNLYSSQGILLKKLHCPLHKSWDQLQTQNGAHRLCTSCQHTVHDTAVLTEAELIQLLEKEPTACLKINLNQDNLRIQHAW